MLFILLYTIQQKQINSTIEQYFKSYFNNNLKKIEIYPTIKPFMQYLLNMFMFIYICVCYESNKNLWYVKP